MAEKEGEEESHKNIEYIVLAEFDINHGSTVREQVFSLLSFLFLLSSFFSFSSLFSLFFLRYPFLLFLYSLPFLFSLVES